MKKRSYKRKRKGLSLKVNKQFFGIFFGLLSFVLVINATFSWSSFARWRQNHMQGNKEIVLPSIDVVGHFGSVLTHQSGLTPEIKVVNTGKIPVFIRVNIKEVLLTLEVDTTDRTGNGHLNIYSSLEGRPKVSLDYPETWQLNGRFTQNDVEYYQTDKLSTYQYRKDHENQPKDLSFIDYTWGIVDPTAPTKTGYWLYQEQGTEHTGYYYYSKLVNPGDSTTVLLDKVELANEAPNRLKGSLYRVDVNANAGEATDGVYGEWEIPQVSGNPVYDAFEHELSVR